MSTIPMKLKEETYIRLYFNTNKGLPLAGIRRAYLDFNRTLPFKGEIDVETESQRNSSRDTSEKYILEGLEILKSKNYTNQTEFDIDIKNLIEGLSKQWPKLSIGQSQKWINMTLKYWLLFGNERIPNIESNAKYFHVPIDSIIQNRCFIHLENSPWSKIGSYSSYFNYQLEFRKLHGSEFGLLKEFEIFNQR
jgi:hypothetical protein